MAFPDFLDKRGTVKTYAKGTADGMGGYAASTWSVLYRRVPFAFVPLTKRADEVIVTRDKEEVLADFMCYLEYRSGIKEGDRIYWGGRIFEIKLILVWREMARTMKLKVVEKNRLE